MVEAYIQRILNGDKDAFRYIITKYKDIGYSYAMSIVKDEFLAQEVMQVSFIRAYSKLNTFKGESKFSTWLYRIVVNESFKILKNNKKEITVFDEFSSKTSIDIDDSNSESSIDYQKYYINETLKRMAPKESLVLRLFYLEEHSIKDIIEITGWTNSNIKVLLHRARTNMKKIMPKHLTNG